MTEVRLTHPALDFWVDARIDKVDGTWVAVADLADQPELAASTRPDVALLLALWPLGAAIARRLVARADPPSVSVELVPDPEGNDRQPAADVRDMDRTGGRRPARGRSYRPARRDGDLRPERIEPLRDPGWELVGNQRFQFGDFRLQTPRLVAVIEIDTAGGATNLAKYWPLLVSRSPMLAGRCFVLGHLFAVGSANDYISHLRQWDFLLERMREDLEARGIVWERDWAARGFVGRNVAASVTEIAAFIRQFDRA